MKNSKLVLFALLALIGASCSSDIDQEPQTTQYEDNSHFYLDGEEIAAEDFDPNDNSQIGFIVLEETSAGQSYTYHQFSNEESILQFGKDNKYDISTVLDFDKRLSQYVVETDAISYQEQMGEVNPEHQAAMNELHSKYFQSADSRSPIPTILYDNCAGGPWTLLPGTLPFMGNWRNRIDSYLFPSLITGMLICDRTWYRGPRWIVTGNFQDGRTCLPGWMSNRMESGYHISI